MNLRQNRARSRWIGTLLAVAGILGLAAPLAFAAESRSTSSEDRPVIDIEHKGPIKVVIQMTTADMQDGVGKGLLALKKLHAGYVTAGVDPQHLAIHAVIHGEGAVHLLTDEAWNRVRNESNGNPSTELIAELAKKGISVELCDSRRQQNRWAKSDVHRDVLLVKGAYHRIIDLQLRGFAYIRF